MKETLEQAVKRISREARTSQTVLSGDGLLTHVGQSRLEAALREMAAFQRERDAEIMDKWPCWSDFEHCDEVSGAMVQAAAAIRKGE